MCKKSTKIVFARGFKGIMSKKYTKEKKRKALPTVINWCNTHSYTLNNKQLLAMTADEALILVLEILLMFESEINRHK